MPAVHLEICGEVQGVGFRWFTVRAARRMGIRGWVRNRDDGCVELAAEGETAALAEFVDEVTHGPPGARVERVRELPVNESGRFGAEFQVAR